jgi:type II secretory pathway component PulF
MAVYQYTARRMPTDAQRALLSPEQIEQITRREIHASVEASSAEEVVRSLEERSMRVIAVKALNGSGVAWWLSSIFSERPTEDTLLMFYRSLRNLLRTGGSEMSKGTALDAIAEQIREPEFREAILSVRDDLTRSLPMGEGMEKRPKMFEPKHAALVKAGESAGITVLVNVFDQIATMIMKRRRTVGALVNALAEPALIVVSFIGLIVYFISATGPLLEDSYKQFHAPIPGTTQALLNLGVLASRWPTYIVALPIVGLIAFALGRYLRTENGLFAFHTFLANLIIQIGPFKRFRVDIGMLFRFSWQAEVLRMLGSLLVAKVPTQEAIRTVIPVAGSPIYARALSEIATARTLGEQLATLIAEAGVFDPIVTSYLAVAGKGANMGEAMLTIAADLEEAVDMGVTRLSSQLRPIIIIVLGIVMAPILSAMLVPFYTLGAAAANG